MKSPGQATVIIRILLLQLLISLCFVLGHAETDKANSAPSQQTDMQGSFDLQKSLREHKHLSRLYPLLYREEKGLKPDWDPDFEKWRGRRIGKIEVIAMDVFDFDSQKYSVISELVDWGNRLHPKTKEKTVRSHLYFAEGDSLKPEYLVSNLHYLYDQALFSEIQFVVSEMDTGDVAISVRLRQKFFLQFGGKYKSLDEFQFRVANRNFLGLGHSLNNTWFIDPNNQGSIGWESSYINPNILGTFFHKEISWTDLPGYSRLGADLHRPFLYPLFRYSGGLDYMKTAISAPHDTIAVKKQKAGIWMARDFDAFQYPKHAYAALSLEPTWHQKRPYESVEYGMPWQNSLFALSALGITRSSYKYMPRISSFFDNDYLPVGYLFELYGGVDLGEYKTRPYLGLHSAWSVFPGEDQYLYLSSSLESFVDRGEAEQTIFAVEPTYISATKTMGRLKGRSLIRAKMLKTWDLWPHQEINLDTEQIYRGTRNLSGTDFFFISLEEDISLPVSVLGFQLTTFGFVDLAIMQDRRRETDKSDNIFSEGLGMRLRNPSLIWDFIEVYFSMDHRPSKDPAFRIELKLKKALALKDFRGRRPQVYPLNR